MKNPKHVSFGQIRNCRRHELAEFEYGVFLKLYATHHRNGYLLGGVAVKILFST